MGQSIGAFGVILLCTGALKKLMDLHREKIKLCKSVTRIGSWFVEHSTNSCRNYW